MCFLRIHFNFLVLFYVKTVIYKFGVFLLIKQLQINGSQMVSGLS